MLLVGTLSFGQVILQDDFNYTDGGLLTDNSWTSVSGGTTNPIAVGTSNGLSYTGYSGLTGILASNVGNAAIINNTGQDVAKTFTATTTGSVYMSFMLNIVNATSGYYIGLGNGGTTYTARVFVQPGSTGTTFNLGVSNSSTATYASTPTDFNLGQTYLVIVKYNISSQTATLWCKSTGIPADEVAAGTAEVTSTGGGLTAISSAFIRQYSASQHQIVDGLLIASSWMGSTPCPLTLGSQVATCDATTLALDTYNVTIPFTGGATGTYNLSTTSGTIGGDNPTSTASGNITISGVTEGTNVTLTISGSCSLNSVISAPECKPVNTLPYHEPFNYTAAQTLGSQQMWTNVNSGDDVVIKAGNLTYGSTTGTGNSVEFSGAGMDPFSPFTATTSGTVYAGFMMKVSDLTNVTDGNEDYFALFTDANKGFQARFFIKRTGTQYQLGFDSSGTTTTNYDATLRNVGDVVYVILGYDFATNTLNAWLNPNLATFNAATTASLTKDVTASPIAEIGGFMIRQGGSSNLPTIEMDELKISTVSTTFLGTIAFNAIDGFKMYPNPSNGNTLYFTTVANAELDVQVYDMLGKQVINSKVSNNALNISGLNQGIYIVKITEEGKTATRKLVVR